MLSIILNAEKLLWWCTSFITERHTLYYAQASCNCFSKEIGEGVPSLQWTRYGRVCSGTTTYILLFREERDKKKSMFTERLDITQRKQKPSWLMTMVLYSILVTQSNARGQWMTNWMHKVCSVCIYIWETPSIQILHLSSSISWPHTKKNSILAIIRIIIETTHNIIISPSKYLHFNQTSSG